ncbi:MAG: ABC transporter permease [Streptococcaceae bacterium]|nr:ABC transporter permease [Streptococcaceae bacterium]
MLSQTWLVAKNVYRNRFKSAGFWALILVPLLVPIIGLIMGWLIGSTNDGNAKLVIVNQPALVQTLKHDKQAKFDLSETSDEAQAKSQLQEGKIDGYLTENQGHFTLTTSSKTSSKFNQQVLESTLTNLQILERSSKLGISQVQLAQLMTPVQLSLSTVSQTGNKVTGNHQAGNNLLAIGTAVVILMLLSLYVGVIAQEIANEKSNRIMEILLATTSSKVQYYGKIIGVMLLALTQIVIYVIGFTVAFLAFKENSMVKMVTSFFGTVDTGFFAYVIVMSLLAIVGYLFIASIVASLINDQAQVQQATSPIMYLALIGYLSSIASAQAPTNVILKVLSFIPFVSPTLMSSRYAVQVATTQEALIALILQFVAVLAIARFGERIYSRNVLSYSNERIFKQLINNVRGKDSSKTRGNLYTGRKITPKKLILAGVIIVIILIIRYFLKH